jgi:hypothetical protein
MEDRMEGRMEDPEIEAMSAVAGALAQLDEDATGRVLRWAAERYGVGLAVARRGRASDMGLQDEETDLEPPDQETEVSDQEISAEAPEFEHFAELYDAAGPTTDVDRVLVAGYWQQAIRGMPSFQALELHKELKNLGHTIGNVTDALTNNKERKPARILQLRKSGSTRQARKTYKLTHEGLVYVQGMIAASA